MTIEMVGSIIFDKVVSALPGWLVRFFLSKQKIASLIEVDLRSTNPINICFGTEIPSISIYFRITNLSHINLVLDRLLIELWIGQPTINGAILEHYDLPKSKSVENIYFTKQLTTLQIEQIKKKISNKHISVTVTIHFTAYFNSKIGIIRVKNTLTAEDVPCK